MKNRIGVFAVMMGFAIAANAEVFISTVGNGDGYDATAAQSQGWRSTSVDKGDFI